MKNIVVIGAGKIGSTIARLLIHSGDYHVTLADRSKQQLEHMEANSALSLAEIDVADHAAVVKLLSGKFAVLSAAPFHLTIAIAEAAAEAGVHYLDLTEDVESTRRVKAIAAGASTAFIPPC